MRAALVVACNVHARGRTSSRSSFALPDSPGYVAVAGAGVTLDCISQDLGLDPIVSNLELEKVDPNLRALTQATQGALLLGSLVWSAIPSGHFSHSARAGVVTVACGISFHVDALTATFIFVQNSKRGVLAHGAREHAFRAQRLAIEAIARLKWVPNSRGSRMRVQEWQAGDACS